jgi:hypothetical protein
LIQTLMQASQTNPSQTHQGQAQLLDQQVRPTKQAKKDEAVHHLQLLLTSQFLPGLLHHLGELGPKHRQEQHL